VEVLETGDTVWVRDSANPGVMLPVPAESWVAFLAGVRAEALRAAADDLIAMTTDPFDLLTESVGIRGPVAVSLWLQDRATKAVTDA